MQLFPLRFFPEKTHFDFMGTRWIGFTISIALSVLCFVIIFTKGLNLGIDFTGGILMDVRSQQTIDLAAVRHALEGQGLGEYSLQNFGDTKEIMVRVQMAEGQDQSQIVAKVKGRLAAVVSDADYRSIEFVGPTVGRELIQDGIWATLLSLAGILAYLWFRFELQYGFGGVLALMHDAVMMIGFYALTRMDFGLNALAAVLTIIGYSINDSVVIYDRIRENMRKYKKMPLSELINLSVNETLSRTVLTAGTVLLASLSLALLGGEVLKSFAWGMVFGIVTGTYSSIYISAPMLVYLGIRKGQHHFEEKAA
jgi:preprotein translocase subunit SecF